MACVTCLSGTADYIVTTCMHVCICSTCADALMRVAPHTRKCLVCEQPVTSVRKCEHEHWIFK